MSAPALERRTVRRATSSAAVVSAPGVVAIRTLALAEPGAGQVRVALEGSGVCASNIPLWQGRPWFTYPAAPGAPGHEGWGWIDAVGDGVTGLEVGQRVAVLSYNAYATHDLAAADAVVPLPESLGDMPFPAEPLGCAMNVLRRSEIEPGHTVVIVGVGFLGALLTRLAANAGARVIAVSRRQYARDVATAFGAAETIPIDDTSHAIIRVKELTDGVLADRVIECIGTQGALDLSTELTRERGRLVVAGFHQDGPRQVNMFLWNWRGIDVVNAHERDSAQYVRGMREAVDAVASGALDPSPLYTHRFPLERLDAALDAAIERPDGFLKALVTT